MKPVFITKLENAYDLLDAKKLEQSHREFKKLLKENPGDSDVYFGIGTYYALTEQYYQSKRFINKAIELDPENADYYFNLAVTCLELLSLNAARKALSKYLKLKPNGEQASTAKKMLSKISNAIEDEKEQRPHLSTDQIFIYGDLFHDGCRLLEQGDYEEAIATFEKAAIVDRQSPKAYRNIGLAYCQMGEIEKAIHYLKRSISIDPDYTMAKMNLASIEEHSRRYTKITLEREFFLEIEKTISNFRYSVEPFLRASRRINVYSNFFELEDFYYHDWEKQELHKAMGLCQHLSYLTKIFLSDLVIRHIKFTDDYDVFYASGVYESYFFNLKNCNHICLIVFKKGERENGWIIDPSLKLIKKCYKEPNCDRDIINSTEVFSINSTHRYLINANLGGSIREELQVKEDAFTHYSSSFNSYLPLFIFKDRSLILASFKMEEGRVFVEYYEHKKNCEFDQIALIDTHSSKYKQLYNYSQIFSIIDSLLTKISLVDDAKLDRHKRLISAELEEDYMMILYYIELAVVETFRKDPGLTDKIVANVLKELKYQKEDKQLRLDYIETEDEKIHFKLENRIESYHLDLKCPPKILINALDQVLGSVNGFRKRSSSNKDYLHFITAYFSHCD